MNRRGLVSRMICVIVSVNLFCINCIWAEGINHLAADSNNVLKSVLRGFSMLATPLVLHKGITTEGISGLKKLAEELDDLKKLLVGKGILKRDDAEKYYAMVFEDKRGVKAYYYFSKDGYFFRITNLNETVSDDFYKAFLTVKGSKSGEPIIADGYNLEIYKINEENMQAVLTCMENLYGVSFKQRDESASANRSMVLSDMVSQYIPHEKKRELLEKIDGLRNESAFKAAAEKVYIRLAGLWGGDIEEQDMESILEGLIDIFKSPYWQNQRDAIDIYVKLLSIRIKEQGKRESILKKLKKDFRQTDFDLTEMARKTFHKNSQNWSRTGLDYNRIIDIIKHHLREKIKAHRQGVLMAYGILAKNWVVDSSRREVILKEIRDMRGDADIGSTAIDLYGRLAGEWVVDSNEREKILAEIKSLIIGETDRLNEVIRTYTKLASKWITDNKKRKGLLKGIERMFHAERVPVRKFAVEVYGILMEKWADNSEEIKEALNKLSNLFKDGEINSEAIEAYFKLSKKLEVNPRDREELFNLIQGLLEHRDPFIRKRALLVYSRLAGEYIVDDYKKNRVLDMLKSKIRDKEVRQSAIEQYAVLSLKWVSDKQKDEKAVREIMVFISDIQQEALHAYKLLVDKWLTGTEERKRTLYEMKKMFEGNKRNLVAFDVYCELAGKWIKSKIEKKRILEEAKEYCDYLSLGDEYDLASGGNDDYVEGIRIYCRLAEDWVKDVHGRNEIFNRLNKTLLGKTASPMHDNKIINAYVGLARKWAVSASAKDRILKEVKKMFTDKGQGTIDSAVILYSRLLFLFGGKWLSDFIISAVDKMDGLNIRILVLIMKQLCEDREDDEHYNVFDILSPTETGSEAKASAIAKMAKSYEYTEFYEIAFEDARLMQEVKTINRRDSAEEEKMILNRVVGRLVSEYGKGILAVVNAVRIVDNISFSSKPDISEGKLPYSMLIKEGERYVLLLDIDAFKDENLLYLVLEHELRHSIVHLIPGIDTATEELYTNYITLKTALEKGIKLDRGPIARIGADEEFLNALEVLWKMKEANEKITDEKIIAIAIEYMRGMGYYKKLFQQFCFAGNWVEKIKNTEDRYKAALRVFNEIAEARKVARKVKEIEVEVEINILSQRMREISNSGSVRAYLEQSKDAIKGLVKGQRVHVVIGTEACDLDSIVSSVTYAYVKQQADTEELFVPILNIPKDDFQLRPEGVYLLSLLGINENALLFKDDLKELLKKGVDVKLTLVDHNKLADDLGNLGDKVEERIDHHKDEKVSYPNEISKEIDTQVGSNCTLVAERILKTDSLDKAPELVLFLLSAILLDTLNLDEKKGIGKDKDRSAVKTLIERIGISQDIIFKVIRMAQRNIWGLSALDLLRRDFKQSQIGSISCGYSTISPITPDGFAKWESEDLANVLEKYRKDNNLDVLFVLLVDDDDKGGVERWLTISTEDTELMNLLINFLKDDRGRQKPLQMKEAEDGLSIANKDLKTFSIWNKISRKDLKPLIEGFLCEYSRVKKSMEKIKMITGRMSVLELDFVDTLVGSNKFIRLDIDELAKPENRHIVEWLKRIMERKEKSPFVFYSSTMQGIDDFLRENGLIQAELPAGIKAEDIIEPVEFERVSDQLPQDRLYLPLLYSVSSIYLAGQVVLAGGNVSAIQDKLARNTIEALYKTLLGREITEKELEQLFRMPWRILPPITQITGTINAMRKAIQQIEIAA